MTTKLTPLIAILALALAPAMQAAGDPAVPSESAATGRVVPDAPSPAAEAAPADSVKQADDIITLPAVQVTKSRIREIDITIKRIDKLINRERKQLKSTETDRALNNDRVAKAAALLGGYSTAQRTAVAAERVRLLESERELLEQLKAPMTRENFILVEKQVEMLRTTRRELDIVYR